MNKKYTTPLPLMGCGVVERHLEMAQPTKKNFNACRSIGHVPTMFKTKINLIEFTNSDCFSNKILLTIPICFPQKNPKLKASCCQKSKEAKGTKVQPSTAKLFTHHRHPWTQKCRWPWSFSTPGSVTRSACPRTRWTRTRSTTWRSRSTAAWPERSWARWRQQRGKSWPSHSSNAISRKQKTAPPKNHFNCLLWSAFLFWTL